MRLIPNWRRAWRMFSVQAMALAGAIHATWPLIPEDMKATLSPALVHWVSVALLVAGIVGRMVDQPKVKQHKVEESDPVARYPWAGQERRKP